MGLWCNFLSCALDVGHLDSFLFVSQTLSRVSVPPWVQALGMRLWWVLMQLEHGAAFNHYLLDHFLGSAYIKEIIGTKAEKDLYKNF